MILDMNPMGPPMGQQSQYSQSTVPLNVPPGLEYLTVIDQLFIKQKVELLES